MIFIRLRWTVEECVSSKTISLLIVAQNEELNIGDCIKSGLFADEIIVLLDRSQDSTGSIATGLGAKIVEGVWPDEGERRMRGIDACTGSWVLELDVDERISPELAEEIKQTVRSSNKDFYLIPFRNFIGDHDVKCGWGAYNGVGAKAALFRRGKKLWHQGTVHPKIELKGKKGQLSNPINHFVYNDLTDMYHRLNKYSTAAAFDAVARTNFPNGFSTFRRFFSRFFRSYFQKQGFREGWVGVALGLFSATYPVLTHLKIKELLLKPKNKTLN